MRLHEDMARIKTEEDLGQSLWWWRHCRFAETPCQANASRAYKINEAERREWKDGMEQTAQGWELVRRVRPDLNWPPFYDVGGYLAQNLRVRIYPARMRWKKKITTEASPKGWTDPNSGGGDGTLVALKMLCAVLMLRDSLRANRRFRKYSTAL